MIFPSVCLSESGLCRLEESLLQNHMYTKSEFRDGRNQILNRKS